MLKRRGGPRRRTGAAGAGGSSASTSEGLRWLGWLCGACCNVMAFCLGLARGPGAHGGTQCGCEAGSGPYERLNTSSASQLELSALEIDPEDKDAATEKEEALVFHTDSGRRQRVVVERHLCSSDLCRVLAVKFGVSPAEGVWSLVQHWPSIGLERTLEDHEQVLAVHRESERGSNHRFIFRRDVRRYRFFENPRTFFPNDMIDFRGWKHVPEKENDSDAPSKTLCMDWTPMAFTYMWVKERFRRSSPWAKAFVLLKGDKLYACHKQSHNCTLASHLKALALSTPGQLRCDVEPELRVIAKLSEVHIFTSLNARNHFRAPTEFGFCLRPLTASPSPSPPSSPPSSPPFGGDMLCLAVESESSRQCWVTAMRLAKYGKQLRENYRLLRNSQGESSLGSSADCGGSSSSLLSQEHVRARVAMDFTGSVGRIVDDPNEARAVAEAEGDAWRRRWRPPVPRPSSIAASVPRRVSSTTTAHLAQAWFLGGVTREQAARLLSRPGTLDGVFLVRESRSVVGSYVLSLRAGGKVVHSQIHPLHDPARGTLCFSLDGGATKFFDLLQLVEFYQLNSGCLPTRLLHSPESTSPTTALHPSSF